MVVVSLRVSAIVIVMVMVIVVGRLIVTAIMTAILKPQIIGFCNDNSDRNGKCKCKSKSKRVVVYTAGLETHATELVYLS